MLKKNLCEFDINPFTDLENKWALVVTGNRTTGPNAMTVSWGGFGRIWEKNVCFIFIRKSRYSHELLDKSDSISIAFLSDKYKDAKVLMGRKSGKDIDKFKETGLHAGVDPDFNGFIISEAERVIKCKTIYKTDIEYDKLPDIIKEDCYKTKDMHTMYICEVREYLTNEE